MSNESLDKLAEVEWGIIVKVANDLILSHPAINRHPTKEDIPKILELIGEEDTTTLELLNAYIEKATDCIDNAGSAEYGGLTDERDLTFKLVNDRIKYLTDNKLLKTQPL